MIRFTIIIIALSSTFASAADRYWVGIMNTNWSDQQNWSVTSGGLGGATVPGALDVAQIDNDKQFDYSTVIRVELERAVDPIRFFPNPCNDHLNVTLSSSHHNAKSFIVRNKGGRVIILDDFLFLDLDLSELVQALPSGIYFLTLADGDALIHKKLIVQK